MTTKSCTSWELSPPISSYFAYCLLQICFALRALPAIDVGVSQMIKTNENVVTSRSNIQVATMLINFSHSL